jgi:uncharacterized membrane protein|tara:strand:- start:3105 stop:3602 length:498 start_codon:yes stop_codon:yes gene_type:complete
MVEILVSYIEYISNNPLIATFIIAMLPLTELRGSMPWAYLFTELPLILIFIASVGGNFIVTVPIINLLGPSINFFSRWPIGNQFICWILNRTRKKGVKIEKFHFWGLVMFVGIPLPVTGAWTACIAAYLFGIPRIKSLIAIFIGLCLSASIVSILLLTGNWIINT